MSNFIVKVNDRVEIIIDNKIFKSIIQDIEEDSIKINIPVCDGEYLSLRTNDILELNSYSNGKYFNFHCEVIERGRENNIIYYKLSSPYKVKEIQRRDFVRVDFLNIVEFKKISKENNNEETDGFKEALMIDLSGGGMRFKTKEKLQKYDEVILEFKLNDKINCLNAKIIRLEKTDRNEYIYGVKFINISENKREKVIKEIFNIMRKQRERL